MTQILSAFISAGLIFNGIPHLVQGICGKRHMTHLSPSSSAVLNVIWGWLNLGAGIAVAHVSHWDQWGNLSWSAFAAGGMIVSLSLALFWSNPNARLPWHRNR